MPKQFALDLQMLHDFLRINTPEPWLDYAINNIPLLLLDHAHCERKAAATAINFMSKYPEKPELITMMPPLAREELLHFEKVIQLMKTRGLVYAPLRSSGYATCMHQRITQKDGLERLCDQLIIGAIIEARSCERFHALSLLIKDEELSRFYLSLVKAEIRHFEKYLSLAKFYSRNINNRLDRFLKLENEFILASDGVFRFHSGIPECSE